MKTCISSHETWRMTDRFVVSGIMKCMFQRRRCCAFSAQSTIYFDARKYELWYKMKNSTPSVLRFLSVIHQESLRYNHVFIEKAQHLWRWISLRTFTRGRLVPRQPRAIKNTTRTELHNKSIFNGGKFHWEFTIMPTALHHEGCHNVEHIHREIIIIQTRLWGVTFEMTDAFIRKLAQHLRRWPPHYTHNLR